MNFIFGLKGKGFFQPKPEIEKSFRHAFHVKHLFTFEDV